jgi:hypothetical protein
MECMILLLVRSLRDTDVDRPIKLQGIGLRESGQKREIHSCMSLIVGRCVLDLVLLVLLKAVLLNLRFSVNFCAVIDSVIRINRP